MILSVGLGVLVLGATGIYLLLSRDLFRVVVGISILGSAINLVVFASGRLTTRLPPIMQAGETTLSEGANPLPQALVLTAIVIGFALTCFALVLCVTIARHARTNDLLELTFAEPIASDGVKPPLEDDPPEGFSKPSEFWIADDLREANGLRERSGGGREKGLCEVTGPLEVAGTVELAGVHRPAGAGGRGEAAWISASRQDKIPPSLLDKNRAVLARGSEADGDDKTTHEAEAKDDAEAKGGDKHDREVPR